MLPEMNDEFLPKIHKGILRSIREKIKNSIEKWEKTINRRFTEEKIKVADKHTCTSNKANANL